MSTLLKTIRRSVRRLRGTPPPRTDARRALLELLPPGSVGAEIGVHLGDFSRRLLDVVRPAKLYLIDPWLHMSSEQYQQAWYGGQARGGQKEMDTRYDQVLTRFAAEIRSGQVEVRRGLSTEVGQTLPDAHLDWVYIDGNHLYEFAKQDLELYFGKVRDGGYLTGDDYREGGWWHGGVRKAVDEFVASHPVDWVFAKHDQFVLRKRSLTEPVKTA
jgi:hypothetical protein